MRYTINYSHILLKNRRKDHQRLFESMLRDAKESGAEVMAKRGRPFLILAFPTEAERDGFLQTHSGEDGYREAKAQRGADIP